MQTQTTLSYKFIKQNADTLTPIGIFSNLHGQKKFLLESSYPHEKKGKFSFIGADPYQEIIGMQNKTRIINYEKESEELIERPALSVLKDYFPKQEVDLPFPFIGGGIGYIGYDAIRAYRSEEHTSELQSRGHLVCRLLLEKKNQMKASLDRSRSMQRSENKTSWRTSVAD